jgi:UDP-N-acetylmuramoylalanine--D-glutamate ligase
MLASILAEGGLRAAVCGGRGLPLVEVVMDPAAYDMLVVGLTSLQLRDTREMACESAAVLNVADHARRPASSLEAYGADLGRAYEGVARACVYNVADQATEDLVREAEVVEGARAIGFTLGVPGVGMLGLVDDVLADRAFIEQRQTNAAELCALADLASPSPHVVADALAAAALARARGVSPQAVRAGLRTFRLDRHSTSEVGVYAGVRYVDDARATNAHAARWSLLGFDPVVWVAAPAPGEPDLGGLAAAVADRLRGVVLLGRDRAGLTEALRRHAPNVPVIAVDAGETEAMDSAVRAAADLARGGDTVLFAPGAASGQMSAPDLARGEAFVESVRRLRER